MKKEYDVPEFELIKMTFSADVLNASAEGDPHQLVGDAGDVPIE